MKKERVAALILAAGSGERMRSETPKQFLPIDEKPMVLYSVDAFEGRADLIFVVTNPDAVGRMKELMKEAGLSGAVTVVAGGRTRSESAHLGLMALEEAGGSDVVLIHDAARCLITGDVIDRVTADVRAFGTGVAGISAKNTMKLVDDAETVVSTVERSHCREIQTPQGFRFDSIRKAYEEAAKDGFPAGITDDAMVLETYGGLPVHISEGSEENFKVTTPFDLMMAETVLTIRRLKRDAEGGING